MKFFEEFKEAYPQIIHAQNESNLSIFVDETGMDFDDAIDENVLISYFNWLKKKDYCYHLILKCYKTAKLYTQFVNKKLNKEFNTEGLVNVRAIYRTVDLPYLFFDDLYDDIEEEIKLWIDGKAIDNKELLEDGFYEFKAIISLLWFGFQLRVLPTISREDIDLKEHTVCGVYIYNLNAWNCIKDLYNLDIYHKETFGNVIESKYIDTGFLFRHKTRPNNSVTVPLRRIQNEMQHAYEKLDISRLTANEITLLGFMSRFCKEENGLESIYDNKDSFYNYISNNIKSLASDSVGAIYNKRATYESLDIYKTNLLKYLIKAVDIESKL